MLLEGRRPSPSLPMWKNAQDLSDGHQWCGCSGAAASQHLTSYFGSVRPEEGYQIQTGSLKGFWMLK